MAMQTTAEATPIFVEKRFPLQLDPMIPGIRDLYDAGKAGRWQPQRDLDWKALRRTAAALPVDVREAAALAWSRRAWIESTALKETAALLVRFCIEEGRESDPKLFLTVRGTEEAWHMETCDQVARAFGGLAERPSTPAYEALFSRCLHRRGLDARQFLDAYVATFCAFEDGLELELFRRYRQATTEPVLAALLDRCIAAKERHAAFGWLYLEERCQGWNDEDRAAIAASIEEHVRTVELAGYHCPWLSNAAGAEAAADAKAAAAGLGAATAAAEAEALRSFTAEARTRLAAMGVHLPAFQHPLVGGF